MPSTINKKKSTEAPSMRKHFFIGLGMVIKAILKATLVGAVVFAIFNVIGYHLDANGILGVVMESRRSDTYFGRAFFLFMVGFANVLVAAIAAGFTAFVLFIIFYAIACIGGYDEKENSDCNSNQKNGND